MKMSASLYPPLNFGYVQDHLFRSAIPNEINFQFLQTLQLKTIIILSPEIVDSQLYNDSPLSPPPLSHAFTTLIIFCFDLISLCVL